MKRALAILILLPLFSLFAFSADVSQTHEIEESFFSSLDSETERLLSDFGIDSFSDAEKLLDGSWGKLKAYFTETLTEKLSQASSWFFLMLSVLMLLSVGTSFFELSQSGDMLSFLSVTALTVLFSLRVSPLLSAAAAAMKLTGGFIAAFVPVFTLLIALSGNPATALTYNSLVLTFCQGLSAFLNYVLVSLTGAYLSLTVSFSFGGTVNLTRFTAAVNRLANIVLGLVSSVFSALLTFRSVLSQNADSIASKGTRFLLSSLVPVIGSSISEAYSSVLGSISLLRGSLGVIGIFAVVLINLPVLTEGMIYYLMLCFLASAAEVLSLMKAGELLRGFASCVKIILLAGVLEGLVFVISAGLTLGRG